VIDEKLRKERERRRCGIEEEEEENLSVMIETT
jgi:hypothetical protein